MCNRKLHSSSELNVVVSSVPVGSGYNSSVLRSYMPKCAYRSGRYSKAGSMFPFVLWFLPCVDESIRTAT